MISLLSCPCILATSDTQRFWIYREYIWAFLPPIQHRAKTDIVLAEITCCVVIDGVRGLKCAWASVLLNQQLAWGEGGYRPTSIERETIYSQETRPDSDMMLTVTHPASTGRHSTKIQQMPSIFWGGGVLVASCHAILGRKIANVSQRNTSLSGTSWTLSFEVKRNQNHAKRCRAEYPTK